VLPPSEQDDRPEKFRGINPGTAAQNRVRLSVSKLAISRKVATD
jgi:hypothetical protein